MVFHFSIKKIKNSKNDRKVSDVWKNIERIFKLDYTHICKMKTLFYGNNLFVYLSPFDYYVALPIFNPSSIIRTDKTYNFISVEIPSDRGNDKAAASLPYKLSDINLKFVCGKITDQEDSMLEETENVISIDQDLGMNSNDPIDSFLTQNHSVIKALVKELVIYYKRNDQIK
mmetsp:Transcript_10408/g.11665  ORF Transcript_10408/g.11665 Transcript_10408/m.11665 type:complete len:172 (+) Transcript_10408:414-929(+)